MIRPATPDELDYVTATWISGMQRGQHHGRAARSRIRAAIEMLVETQPVLVHAAPALDGERNEDVIGWCCTTPLASPAVVHYVYTRNAHGETPMRRRGIARGLLTRAGVNLASIVPYTHATDLLPALLATSGVRGVPFSVEKVIA